MSTDTSMHANIFMLIYMCFCFHIYTHACTHANTHTHTHTQTHIHTHAHCNTDIHIQLKIFSLNIVFNTQGRTQTHLNMWANTNWPKHTYCHVVGFCPWCFCRADMDIFVCKQVLQLKWQLISIKCKVSNEKFSENEDPPSIVFSPFFSQCMLR